MRKSLFILFFSFTMFSPVSNSYSEDKYPFSIPEKILSAKDQEEYYKMGILIRDDIFDQLYPSENKKRVIKFAWEMAKKTQDEMIFYSWQSRDFADKVIQSTYTGLLVSSFNLLMYGGWPKLSTARRAGRGLYVAEHIYESDTSVPLKSKTAVLLEVILPKGSPYLDLTSSDIQQRMKEEKIKPEDIYQADPSLSIKYLRSVCMNWWVLKNTRHLKIQEFTGKGLSVKELITDAYRVRASPLTTEVMRNYVQKILKQ